MQGNELGRSGDRDASEEGWAPPRVGRDAPNRRRRGPSTYAVLVALTAFAAVMLIPFVVVVFNALKTPEEYTAQGPLSPPDGFNLDTMRAFWERTDFGHVLLNSVLISGSVAVLAVLLSVLNAYALGIGRIKGRMWVLVVLLMANTVPQEALVYPLYYISKQFGLYDTKLSVIIVFTVIQAAFGTYLLSSVLSAFPRPLLEAARIDGAAAGRCCGGSSSRSSGRRYRCCSSSSSCGPGTSS